MPPVPANITDLSQTAGSNSPAGSESPALLDDYTRTVFAFIAKLRDGQGLSNPVDLASAATTDIGAQTSPIVRITGTTTITSFGANYAGPRFLTFAGALTLTHNATSLILPGGANITTAVGDCCIAVPNATTPNGWRVVAYQKANGVAVVSDLSSATGTLGIANGGTGATTAAAARTALGLDELVVQAGTVSAFARNSAPTGWLKANGALVSRTTYAALFAAIGTTFGAGDGSTTFALPDLRGEFVRGWDDGRGIDSGRVFASVQGSQNLAHLHDFDYATDPGGGGTYINRVVRSTSNGSSVGSGSGDAVGMSTTGSGGSEARPRNIALLFCIKY